MNSDLFIYSTSTGGPAIQKNTERMKNLVKAATKKDASVVWIDMAENTQKKQEVWALSGKKGVYPLLFQDGTFIGDMPEVENLNEIGELAAKLGAAGNAPLVPMF